VLVETTGESFVAPATAVRIAVTVGAIVHLAADL